MPMTQLESESELEPDYVVSLVKQHDDHVANANFEGDDLAFEMVGNRLTLCDEKLSPKVLMD